LTPPSATITPSTTRASSVVSSHKEIPNGTELAANGEDVANPLSELFGWDDHQVAINLDPNPTSESPADRQMVNPVVPQWAMPGGPTQSWDTAYDNPITAQPVPSDKEPLKKQPKKRKREEEMLEPRAPNTGRGRRVQHPSKRPDQHYNGSAT